MIGTYMVIGDSAEARESLAVLLRSQGHSVTVAPSHPDAIQSLRTSPVDRVLIVCNENDLAARKLRNRILGERWATSVILVSRVVSGLGASRAQRFGIGDYRLSGRELLAMVTADEESDQPERTSETVDPGVDALVQVIDVLVGLRELNDRHHRGSSHRSTYLARTVAERMRLPEAEALEITVATLLRDIGKVEIEDILDETGVYTRTQRTRMQDHVTASVRLLEHIGFPWKVLPIIRHHHEHYDGTGYPDGLRGPEIPLGARILAAVDAYIAMISERPHRACMPSSKAQAELNRLAGKHFDPEVVEVLLQVIHEGNFSLSFDEKPRVLIAEPEAEFLKLLKFRLVNEGMEVRTVRSLEEAVLKLLESPPSIVVAAVDSEPERTLDMLRQIREDPALRSLPFVLLTDTDDRVVKLKALRLGADEFLPKASDLEEIVARIDGILTREAMRRATDDRPQQRGITGRLENLALPEIFQMLNLGLKTARVSLESAEQSGTIWFKSGAVLHAELGEQVGEDACYRMLGWREGQFCIEHGVEAEGSSIETDTMYLVMEGLRRIDEAAEAHAG